MEIDKLHCLLTNLPYIVIIIGLILPNCKFFVCIYGEFLPVCLHVGEDTLCMYVHMSVEAACLCWASGWVAVCIIYSDRVSGTYTSLTLACHFTHVFPGTPFSVSTSQMLRLAKLPMWLFFLGFWVLKYHSSPLLLKHCI